MRINGTNISMTRGDTESITLTLKDINDNIIELVTGDKIYFTVKDNVNTVVKIFQKVISTFTDGVAIIIIEPNDTKLLKYKDYVYDIQLTTVDQVITTIISPSRFRIEGEVTYE